MSGVRSDCRAELSRLLRADASAMDDCSKPPDEAGCLQLAEIIALGVRGTTEEQRNVYEHIPLLLLRFFGFAAGTGWLETGSGCPHSHREALMRVVRPSGALMEFCVARSPPLGSEAKDEEWRFEFPLSNLPSMLLDDFYDVSDGAALAAHVASALAPWLAPCLRRERDGLPALLLLSPLEYFLLCMIASPAQKSTPPAGYTPGTKRVRTKRSASLPSVRAMYNAVLTEHVVFALGCSPEASGGGKSLLIPACLDLLFAPMTGTFTYGAVPESSTPTADAVTCVLLAVAPGSPDDLVLSSGSSVGSHLYPSKELATAALFGMTQELLRTMFSSFPVDSSGPLSTLAAYVRLLALYLAPWKGSVTVALKSLLYPKPRAGLATSSTPSLAIITSKLSAFNAQLQTSLPAVSLRSSPDRPTRGEAAWGDSGVLTTRRDIDRDLLRLALVKCANCRLCASTEGVRALTILADGIKASGLAVYDGSHVANLEEVRGCLHALSDQFSEADRSGRRSKDFLSVLGSGVGVKLNRNGMLSGVAEMVGVSGAAAGVVDIVAGASSVGGSRSRRRLRERRKTELRNSTTEDVPFLGSVWDRPIEARELEIAVVFAYRLATWAEPKLGFVPNIRFVGRRSFVVALFGCLVGSIFLLSLLD